MNSKFKINGFNSSINYVYIVQLFAILDHIRVIVQQLSTILLTILLRMFNNKNLDSTQSSNNSKK